MPLSADDPPPVARAAQRLGDLESSHERAQIAVVDADEELRPQRAARSSSPRRMDLDQGVEAERCRLRRQQLAQRASSEDRAISSTASAPKARASWSWYGSRTKSLRSSGSSDHAPDRLEIRRGFPGRTARRSTPRSPRAPARAYRARSPPDRSRRGSSLATARPSSLPR